MTDKEEQNINGTVGPGRPSKYEKIKGMLDVVRELATNGFTNDQIAQALGIARSTLQDYLNEHQEFADALNGGKILADNQVVSAMFKRAVGYDYVEEHFEYSPGGKKDEEGNEKPAKIKNVKKVKKHVPANIMAGLIWLYNRQRSNWKQKQLELPDNLPKLPEFENFSDDELGRLIKEGLKQFKPE